MARQEPRQLTMEINHRAVTFPEGVTVLRAAELNGVDIPSLCSHKDLSPFGGCRLCMVEIEGMRGYPLSCSTVAQEGMKVLTDTATLRELRQEILKLILSEHPSSCLVCEEREACKDYQGTIRKAGVTTGCRFCPNDRQCELQDLVEKIGITEIDFPIVYHGYDPEHDDPFYDRDYNVCILCGRCVRMCQEVRGSSVLAFTHRGPKVKIGPAFGRSHAEAGCEFCGACVDVCPTGALADKASKWEGKPDGFHVSTCPFCAVGCQIELFHKNGRLTRARANLDPEVNDGQLCVRGRFCQPEVTHHYERARRPMLQKGRYFREVTWDEALERAAAELKGVKPEEFLMLVSPDLTNEGLFAAQKFARECIKSPNIDSTARFELAGGLGLWSKLFSLRISIKDIAKADTILAVGLDSRFDFSVVGTRVRKALDHGARLVTIDPLDSNLARYTDDWLQPSPGMEGLLLKAAADRLAGRETDVPAVAEKADVNADLLARALEIVASGKALTVIIGPRVFHYDDLADLADALATMAGFETINFIPLYFGANSRGALEMGVFSGVAPGIVPGDDAGFGWEEVLSGSQRPRVIYCVGDVAFRERPDCDFLIVQDTYLPPFPVDVFFPASSFAEAGGTLVNMEGRVQEVVQVENFPEGAVTGFMRPDWRIFSDLAKAAGCRALEYGTAADVRSEIRAAVPGFPATIDRQPRRMQPLKELTFPAPAGGKKSAGDFWLVAEPGGYKHRGIDITSKVGGLCELGLEAGFRMHPEDLEALGLESGFGIQVSWDGDKAGVSGEVKADPECGRGAVYFTRRIITGGLKREYEIGKLDALPNPTRVRISRLEI
ncbi:MAG: molybdopterin-dependent oxidoreductase [Candidatus Aminicenantes bacterium]|nr:molybdopterin-dependent oxidoreductase [Candidatus Aminicenantes bacterium]